MTRIAVRHHADSSFVLRTLTVILLSGGSLLVALRDPAAMLSEQYLVGLGVLWGALALELVPAHGRLTRGRLDAILVGLDILAVGLVVAAVRDLPGVSIYFLGPICTAAVRLGREGATAAAALAALGLLLPALLEAGGLNPVDVQTAVGAVLLLASGLATGELVRVVEQRRRHEHDSMLSARRVDHELRMILDNLGSGLLTVDASGHVSRINPAARKILGLGDRTSGGMHLDEILGAAGRELTELVNGALQDGRRRRRAEVAVRTDDLEVPLGVSVDFLSEEDGRLAGAVVVFTDLTEVQRLREHLRRTDRLAGVGELAASIAHELRNPLASIRGSVELLASELEVRDQQEQLMQLILRESNRLNTIITDFLSFARMPSPQPREVSVARFLDDVQLQLEQHVAADDAAVEIACTDQAPDARLFVDPDQLLQAVLNLAINACEAMHHEGRLTVSGTVNGDDVEVRVRDTGPGLPETGHEDIFAPFMTTKKHGTGLGLPMVARIIHGHGGTIEGQNSASGGAEFVIRLPRASSTRNPERLDLAVEAGVLAPVH